MVSNNAGLLWCKTTIIAGLGPFENNVSCPDIYVFREKMPCLSSKSSSSMYNQCTKLLTKYILPNMQSVKPEPDRVVETRQPRGYFKFAWFGQSHSVFDSDQSHMPQYNSLADKCTSFMKCRINPIVLISMQSCKITKNVYRQSRLRTTYPWTLKQIICKDALSALPKPFPTKAIAE